MGDRQPPFLSRLEEYVEIRVYCELDHLVGEWVDSIEEKYPFYCRECDEDLRQGKYPWRLETSIERRKVPID